MAEREQRFLESISPLQSDNDKSKILSVYALLKYDSGAKYSENDYRRAIAWIKAGIAETGDTTDGFMQEGIEWLKERITARQATA